MRIIAKNHDYYDSALAFGHDEHVVFARMEEEYRSEWKKPLPEGYGIMSPALGCREMTYYWAQGSRQGSYDANREGREFSFFPFTVAFCGKLYPGIRLESRKGAMSPWKKDYAYSLDAYTTLLHNFGIEFLDPTKPSRWAWMSYSERKGSPRQKKDCEEYFARSGEDHVAFFAERGKPIALYETTNPNSDSGATLTFNSELKKVAFYKVFDAYTAFQELDMFISGVMARDGNPMAGISDTDLRNKKGFDDMSFKKYPTKKR